MAKAGKLRTGRGRSGPITMPGQIDVIRRHIDDALARGGTGGARRRRRGAAAVRRARPCWSTCRRTPSAVSEETFGPTLTITRVADADEAVRLANDTAYGLGGAVFGKRERDADRPPAALRHGRGQLDADLRRAWAALPFGGVGDSGFGRIHGEDGLREFARAKAITVRRGPSLLPATTFERTPAQVARIVKVLRLLYGRDRPA